MYRIESTSGLILIDPQPDDDTVLAYRVGLVPSLTPPFDIRGDNKVYMGEEWFIEGISGTMACHIATIKFRDGETKLLKTYSYPNRIHRKLPANHTVWQSPNTLHSEVARKFYYAKLIEPEKVDGLWYWRYECESV